MEMLTKRFLLRDFVPEGAARLSGVFALTRDLMRFLEMIGSKPVHAKELLNMHSKWGAELGQGETIDPPLFYATRHKHSSVAVVYGVPVSSLVERNWA